jgi:hypothetical protein
MNEELHEIRELLQELVTKQAIHALEQNGIKEDVEQIKHVLLEGNGSPPMTVRVALAENDLKRLREERDDKKMPRAAWVAIMVSILLALVSIGAAAI